MSLITIGIPTYNRKDIVYKSLMHLINSDLPAEDVEFLVSDNASEDGTFELLSTIEDERLSLYQNDSNINIDGNVYAVLEKSKSTFVLIMSDEDYIVIDELKKFIEELKGNLEYYKNDIGGIVCNRDYYKKICEASDIGHIFTCGYISGILFNKDILDKIDYNGYETLYPHVHTLVRLVNISDIIFYDIEIYMGGKDKGDNYLPEFNTPLERLEQLKLDISIINSINRFTKEELFHLILNMYTIKIKTILSYYSFCRVEFWRNYLKITEDEFTIEKYIYQFNIYLMNYITEFYNNKIDYTREFINQTNLYLYKVMNARYKFELAKLKGYEIVMLQQEVDDLKKEGWEPLSMLKYYGYNVDQVVDSVLVLTNTQILLKYNYNINNHEDCKELNWNYLVRGMRKRLSYMDYNSI